MHPFAQLVGLAEDGIPRALFNRDPAGLEAVPGQQLHPPHKPLRNGFRFQRSDNTRDVFVQGNCDDGTDALVSLLGWGDELAAVHADRSAPIPMAPWATEVGREEP